MRGIFALFPPPLFYSLIFLLLGTRHFFYAKTLAEALDMREEDLQLTWGLAGYAYSHSRISLAEKHYRELAEKAHRYGDFDKENRAYGQLANLAQDPEYARKWTQKAANMWNNAANLNAKAYFTMGDNAERQGDLIVAEEYYKRALAIHEQKEEWTRVVSIYDVLGALERKRGNMEAARDWYQKERKKAKNKGISLLHASASRNLGYLAAERGNIKEAWKHYQEALEIYQALQDKSGIVFTLNGMGLLFTDIGAYDSAKDKLIQSVQIAENIGHKQLTAYNYNALGRLSEAQGDFISAKEWFAKALSMLENLRDEERAAVVQRNLERMTAKLNSGK